MFKKLDIYVYRKFLSTLVLILLMFSLIAVVFDASEKIDKFIRKNVPVEESFRYYYNFFLPYVLNLISPIFIFISSLYFTSRMAYRSEVIAMYSSGMSFWRLLRPYIVIALLLVGVDLYLKNFIIPITNKGLVDFEMTYFDNANKNNDRNIVRRLSDGEFITVERYDFDDSMGFRFAYEVYDGKVLKEKVRATYLRWNHVKREWYANRYFRRIYHDDGSQSMENGDTLYVHIHLQPREFSAQERSITGMKTPELIRFINKEIETGNPDVKLFKVELYQRFSIPFASFILILISFALASRKVRGGTGMHLMLGLLIAVTFILLMRFTITFGQQSSLHPLAAVWIPNVFFLGISIVLLFRAPK